MLFPPGLRELSHGALNELYEELEVTIKDYSETLISELALRDELEFEKELKNQFISLLLNVQKKRRDSQNNERKKTSHLNTLSKKIRGSGPPEPGTVSAPPPTAQSLKIHWFSHFFFQYLTTVIPYHANIGPPTTEQLQIYIKSKKFCSCTNSDLFGY